MMSDSTLNRMITPAEFARNVLRAVEEAAKKHGVPENDLRVMASRMLSSG